MNDVSAANPAEVSQPATAMTPAKGLLILLGVVVVVGAFIGLNLALGIHEFWGGFLFLLYWTGVEHGKFEKLANCVVGALFGLGLAYLLKVLPVWLGEPGGFVFLGLILAVVYCQIMGWLTLAVNMVAMLFLTVGTIPAVQSSTDFASVLVALLLGIVFFGGLLWAVGRFQKKPNA